MDFLIKWLHTFDTFISATHSSSSKKEKHQSMATTGRVIIVMAVISSLIHVSLAISGHATLYKGSVFPNGCNVTKAGNLLTVVSAWMFKAGNSCGLKYYVRCSSDPKVGYPCAKTGEGVIVTIVNVCQRCKRFDMVLSKEAFSKIAAPDAEKVSIDYTWYNGE